MREDVAVERIDTAGGGPGVEGEIVGRTGFHGERIALKRLWQAVAIFRYHIEEVPVQVHRVDHGRVRTKQAQMDGLSMFDLDGLRIREAFAIDHIVAAQHADKFIVLHIRFDGMRCLRTPWTRTNDKGPIETT